MSKSTPLLFKPEMIRACLSGKKRMTRRLVKPQPLGETAPLIEWSSEVACTCGASPATDELRAHAQKLEGRLFTFRGPDGRLTGKRCPYGVVGDEIWAKETWRPSLRCTCADENECACDSYTVRYAADGAINAFCSEQIATDWEIPKAAARGNVSPLFMPRWASRFVRPLKRVRLERLQNITEEDALAEGVKPSDARVVFQDTENGARYSRELSGTAIGAFACLWDKINRDRAPWSSNPWVWVLEW